MRAKKEQYSIILLTDFSKPWNNGWYYKRGLEKNNHEVLPIDPKNYPDFKGRFLDLIKSNKFDFLIYTKDEIDVEYLIECKKYVRVIQWYPDPVVPQWLIPYVKLADVFFTMSEGLVEEFKKYNPNVFWLTQAFEPDFFKIETITEKDIKKYSADIGFIGNLGSKPQYLIRRELLLGLLKKGFNLKWWGPPIPQKISTIPLIFGKLGRAYGGESVYNEGYAKVAKLSKIFLAVDSMPHIRKSMSHRMYMAVGCGAFYMCKYVLGIEEVLIPDKEIITFEEFDELVDKIKFYLSKQELRKKIALQGQQRVLKEHTYEVRIKQMIRILENAIF